MCKDSPKTLEPDEVHKIVRRHHRGAVAAVNVLAVVLIIVMGIYGVRVWSRDDVPPDFAVNWNLLLGGLVLATAYIVVLLLRLWPFSKEASTKARPGKRKELYEALTPERYIIAGSAVTILFLVAVLCGLFVLEQATTLLAGIAFVTPLGVVLNKWGDLGEYYRESQ